MGNQRGRKAAPPKKKQKKELFEGSGALGIMMWVTIALLAACAIMVFVGNSGN